MGEYLRLCASTLSVYIHTQLQTVGRDLDFLAWNLERTVANVECHSTCSQHWEMRIYAKSTNRCFERYIYQRNLSIFLSPGGKYQRYTCFVVDVLLPSLRIGHA